jgi:hypothetical protein
MWPGAEIIVSAIAVCVIRLLENEVRNEESWLVIDLDCNGSS